MLFTNIHRLFTLFERSWRIWSLHFPWSGCQSGFHECWFPTGRFGRVWL